MLDAVATFLSAGKNALDIIKGIRSELPQTAQADMLGDKIEEAESAFTKTEATLAKALGYHLCQCTWPPQIMLWKEADKAYACPNQECGRRISVARQVRQVRRSSWLER